jgi:exonuclease SbcC
MIPIKLTLQGLYSYREKQEIDFTKLTQAGLFGIFGSVGSGKSSILEAISFALYGESERLNNRDNRNYNMMNLKSNELLIDFEFKTHDDTGYRFVVKGKRNSKQFDDVRAFNVSAYRFDDPEWIPIDPKSIEQITGLNYKNFRRTIIIPQGKFQEFLQLNPTERTTMLKELFNLDKYELSDRVIRLESKNNKLKENIDGQLKGIGEIDPVHLETLRNEIVRLDKVITTQKQELEEHRKQEQVLTALKALVQKYDKQKLEHLNLLDKSEYFATLENEIKQFESLSHLFHSDLEQLKLTRKNLQINRLELDQNINRQTVIKQQVSEWKIKIDQLKPQYEVREQLLQTSEELKKILTIHENTTEIATLNARLQKGNQTLLYNDAELESKLTKMSEMEGLLEKKKKNLPNLRDLTEFKQAYLEQRKMQESIKDIAKKQEVILIANAELFRRGEDILKSAPNLSQLVEYKTNIPETSSFEEIAAMKFHESMGQMEEYIEFLEIYLKEKEKEIITFEVQLKLEQYASQLHEGKPCPLCGSLSHPYIFYREEIAQQLDKLKSEKQETEDKLNQLKEILSSLKDNFEQLISNASQHELIYDEVMKIFQKLVQINESTKLLHLSFPQINAELIRYDEESKNIQLTEKELKRLSDELKIANENKARFTKAIHDIEKDFVGRKSTIDLLVQQIKLIKLSDFEDCKDVEINQLIEHYQTTYQTVTTQYHLAEKEFATLTLTLSMLNGKIEAGQQSDLIFVKQLIDIEDRVTQKLSDAGNLELSTVEAILQKQLDCEGEKQRIALYRQQLETVRQTLETLKAEINQRIYLEDEHQKLIQTIHELSTGIDGMNHTLGQYENELKQLNENAERYALLKKEHERLVLRGQDIMELKTLFRSSGFVNYVSTVYLQNLCAAANDRFYQLTRQKLGLELANDNSFQVRDYMNEGKLRSVKTLSGGQTFQASLSLALSLADSIHKIAGSSENFFFLDEGFGTLDKDSLEVVFESLKALRRENRIVGVISHVEDMQQEIETFLKVVNHNEQGSIVEASWEML